eukprot:2989870-Rhodomonas_salina.1
MVMYCQAVARARNSVATLQPLSARPSISFFLSQTRALSGAGAGSRAGGSDGRGACGGGGSRGTRGEGEGEGGASKGRGGGTAVGDWRSGRV